VFQLGVLDAEFNSLLNGVTLADGHRTERKSAAKISISGLIGPVILMEVK
jgi:hypothetical protein